MCLDFASFKNFDTFCDLFVIKLLYRKAQGYLKTGIPMTAEFRPNNF